MARTKCTSRRQEQSGQLTLEQRQAQARQDEERQAAVASAKGRVHLAVAGLAQLGAVLVAAGVMDADRFEIAITGGLGYTLPPVDRHVHRLVCAVLQLLQSGQQNPLSLPFQAVVDGAQQAARAGAGADDDDDDEDDDDEDDGDDDDGDDRDEGGGRSALVHLAGLAARQLHVAVAHAFQDLRLHMTSDAFRVFFNEVAAAHGVRMRAAGTRGGTTPSAVDPHSVGMATLATADSAAKPTTAAETTAAVEGAEKPAVEGAEKPAVEGAAKTAVEGAAKTAVDGAAKTAVEGAAEPAAAVEGAADGGVRKRGRM